MYCEADYCLYQKHCECTLKEISINTLGACDAYAMVTMPDKCLQKAKQFELSAINERQAANPGK